MMGLSTFDTFKHIVDADGAVEVDGARTKALQSVLIGMLRDFDEACSIIGATYTMSGGSCLGAVRHRGFIPWDDDLDLNMSRADFELFASRFDDELGDRYWLHVPGVTPGYDLCFPRIRKKGTVLRTRDDFDNDECGVYIDIFIVENVPSNKLLRLGHGFISMVLGFCYSCRRFYEREREYVSLVGEGSEAASTFKKKAAIGRLLSPLSMDSWVRAWDRWNGLIRSEGTSFVSIPVGRKHYFGETYRREDFFPVSYGEFGGIEVPLPAHPDPYMRALYGTDYMVPPPEEERESHVVFEFDLGQD